MSAWNTSATVQIKPKNKYNGNYGNIRGKIRHTSQKDACEKGLLFMTRE